MNTMGIKHVWIAEGHGNSGRVQANELRVDNLKSGDVIAWAWSIWKEIPALVLTVTSDVNGDMYVKLVILCRDGEVRTVVWDKFWYVTILFSADEVF